MKSAVDHRTLGYLAHLIYQIINHEKTIRDTRQFNHRQWFVFVLSGGAELWWDDVGQQLMALRPNKHLEPSEPKVFEAYIRTAGYAHGKAADVLVPGDINTWHGVTWKISEIVTAVDEPTVEQGSLF